MFNERNSIMSPMGGADGDEDLDLTNLIDLFSMLCALFMMLVSPLAVLSSSLAEAPGESATSGDQPAIVIRLTEQGSLSLNEEPIEMRAVGLRLAEMKQTMSLASVFLAIDKDARYEPSRQLRAIVNRLGIRCDEVARLSQE